MDSSINYVIVEDDIQTCLLLLEILNKQPDLVCLGKYHNVKDALTHIPKINPKVVIIDLKLGRDSGIDLIRSLKPLVPQALFLVITVFDEIDKLFESIKAGATGYIVKSASPSDYSKAIRELVNGGSPLSPGIARKLISTFHSDLDDKSSALTEREKQIIELLAQGLMYKQVAATLSIKMDTVRSHIRHIYEKLQVNSRTDAINKVYKSTR